mmetsp:Transcript_29533/g.71334  ORF Transcript_29533/g.71334 Transcript_29533/m.71334 type:complete len:371 (+) Transcript_29533:1104-2216(+)
MTPSHGVLDGGPPGLGNVPEHGRGRLVVRVPRVLEVVEQAQDGVAGGGGGRGYEGYLIRGHFRRGCGFCGCTIRHWLCGVDDLDVLRGRHQRCIHRAAELQLLLHCHLLRDYCLSSLDLLGGHLLLLPFQGRLIVSGRLSHRVAVNVGLLRLLLLLGGGTAPRRGWISNDCSLLRRLLLLLHEISLLLQLLLWRRGILLLLRLLLRIELLWCRWIQCAQLLLLLLLHQKVLMLLLLSRIGGRRRGLLLSPILQRGSIRILTIIRILRNDTAVLPPKCRTFVFSATSLSSFAIALPVLVQHRPPHSGRDGGGIVIHRPPIIRVIPPCCDTMVGNGRGRGVVRIQLHHHGHPKHAQQYGLDVHTVEEGKDGT